MTGEGMTLLDLVEQQADGDLVRETLAFAAERIMEAEVETRTGAAKGTRSPLREVQRNGCRDRDWDTRAGIGRYLGFCNSRRPHSSLDGRTPDQACFNRPMTEAAAA